MKTQFHRDINAIVEHAINEDEDILRCCGNCEEEVGPMKVGPNQGKSHSYCKRHYLAFLKDNGMGEDSPTYQKYVARPETDFPPDLAQHHELVDFGNREAWMRQRAADREATQRQISARV